MFRVGGDTSECVLSGVILVNAFREGVILVHVRVANCDDVRCVLSPRKICSW